MNGRHPSFALKLGILGLSLVTALCLLGFAYASWTDTLIIDNALDVGTIKYLIAPGACAPSGEESSISYIAAGEDCLELLITQPRGNDIYTAEFAVSNTGSLPFKIASADILDPPDNATITIENTATALDIAGSILDPGQSTPGRISVDFSEDQSGDATFKLVLIFTVWNFE